MGTSGGAFVGRDRDLACLAEAFDGVRAGRGGVVLVGAAGGLGSTRLIDEALRRLVAGRAGAGHGTGAHAAGASDPIVLRSDALPAWRSQPFEALRVALERGLQDRPPLEVAELLGPGADILLPILPHAGLRSGLVARPTPREHRAERTLEAIRALLARLAGDRPLILVVEDLHESDSGTRSAVAFLARTLGDRPVLIVGTHRPDALVIGHPLRATIEAIEDGATAVLRLPLAPLDRFELAGLIEAHEGERPSAPLLLLVAERSGGSPLVAEEVLAARRELSTASLAVPLDQLVRARAARRSAGCRQLLRALAVAGGPLRTAQLAGLLTASGGHGSDGADTRPLTAGGTSDARRGTLPDAEIRSCLAEAADAGFVVADTSPVGPDDPGYRIRHELIAGALAADLLPAERRRVHAAVAAIAADLPAEAERHWLAARDHVEARAAALAAADAADSLGADADSLAHLELAIALQPDADPDAEPGLLLRAAEAAAAAHDLQRAAAYVEASLARPVVAGDRPAAAAHWERLGNLRWEAGDRQGALAAYERARALLAGGAPVDRARILGRLAQVQMLAGSFRAAERLGNEALELATGADDDARGVMAHVLCTLGVIDGWSGRIDRSVERLRAALDVATELGRVDDAFRARANLATVLGLEGRRAEAVEVAFAGIAAAERDGLEDLHGNMLRGQATDFLFYAGRWSEALQVASRALSWIPSGHPFVSVAAYFLVVDAETTYGAAAPRILGRLLLELETIADAQAAIHAYLAAASISLWRGDLGDARRAVESAWGRIRVTEDWVLQGRTASIALAVGAEIAATARDRRDMGTLADVRAWGDGLLIEAERFVAGADVDPAAFSRREAAAEIATARAHRASMAGRDDPATWAAVAATWAPLDRRYDEALARWRQGAALLDTNAMAGLRREGRELAREPLLAAATTAAELGALPLLQAVHDLAERGRVALPADLFDALREAAAAEDAASRGDPARTGPRGGGTPAPRRPGAAAETFGLSARERGVLAEIVAGRTNREIGERLFISEKTVGVHVGNILAKLGVAGRVEAATVAIRLGLVDDLPDASRRAARNARPR